jgi:endonuclease/exonuclease/phosphatase (EEP) superfamily protein YafD
MAKTLNIVKGTFVPARRSIAIGSIHNIQTQYTPARKDAARNYVENALDHVQHRRTALILSGDYNAKPDGPSLEPMRRAPGWRCDQAILKPLDTGPHHTPIDMAWFRDRKEEPDILRLHSHRTIDVDGTDHKGLVVVFRVRAA